MMPLTPMSAHPASEARSVTDDRIADESPKKQGGRPSPMYVTTADGDVRTVVVEPSFDADEKSAKQRAMAEDRESWQGDRSSEEGKADVAERTHPSPGKDERTASHARNLSAHFFDAARIKDRTSPIQTSQGVSFDEQSQRVLSESTFPVQHSSARPQEGQQPSSSPTTGIPPVSPAVNVGQKHRRGFSGDVSNPAFAHRRINSIGNAAPIERGPAYYGSVPGAPAPQDRPGFQPAPAGHHREGSAGLDMLSAAIHASHNVSKEELASAAGAPNPAEEAAPKEEPPADAAPTASTAPQPPQMMRTSPSNAAGGTYEYPQQPPSGTMAAPPFRPPQQQPGYQMPPGYYPYPQGHFYPPVASLPGYHQRPPPHGYPVQYAPPRGPDPYAKGQFHPGQPPMTASTTNPPSHERAESSGKIETEEALFAAQNRNMSYQPPHWGGQLRPGTTTGSQTFVTTMSVGDGSKTMRPTPTQKNVSTNTDPSSEQQPPSAVPATVGHHRKLSSFSSLSTLMNSGLFPEDQSGQGVPLHQRQPSIFSQGPQDAPPVGAHHRSMSSSLSIFQGIDDKVMAGRGHHRSTSSSVSFLGGLDFDPNEAFPPPPQAMDGSGQPVNPFFAPMNSSPFGSAQKPPFGGPPPFGGQARPREAPPTIPVAPVSAPSTENKEGSSRLAAGGTSKRVRRKCSVPDCPNRVVQGGLCISHGAKRKQCKHPGCKKNVKKAGLCSTHGPARKKCEAEGCTKVAVQGGRCIAHGAKKKLCHVESCKKQAILSGMCKKHHDQTVSHRRNSDGSHGSASTASNPNEETEAAAAAAAAEVKSEKPSHKRGLSIFQEVSPENIQTILSEPSPQGGDAAQPDTFGNYPRMM